MNLSAIKENYDILSEGTKAVETPMKSMNTVEPAQGTHLKIHAVNTMRIDPSSTAIGFGDIHSDQKMKGTSFIENNCLPQPEEGFVRESKISYKPFNQTAISFMGGATTISDGFGVKQTFNNQFPP